MSYVIKHEAVKAVVTGKRDGYMDVFNTLDEDVVAMSVASLELRDEEKNRMALENARLRSENDELKKKLEQVAVSTGEFVYYNGEKIDGYIKTTQPGVLQCDFPTAYDHADSKKENKRLSRFMSTSQSELQARAVSNIQKSDRVVDKKDAVKRFGDEIVADYLKEHESELIEKYKPIIIAKYGTKVVTTLNKASDAKTRKKEARAAEVLVMYYNGYTRAKIEDTLAQDKSTAVTYRSILSYLRMIDDSDIERVLGIYDNNKEVFSEIAREEIEKWVTTEVANYKERKEISRRREERKQSKNDEWGE